MIFIVVEKRELTGILFLDTIRPAIDPVDRLNGVAKSDSSARMLAPPASVLRYGFDPAVPIKMELVGELLARIVVDPREAAGLCVRCVRVIARALSAAATAAHSSRTRAAARQ